MSGKVTATEYHGIKYSLRPHGVKSRLLMLASAFVVLFGGALAVVSPAQAAPGDISCFVEVTPGPSSSSGPSPTLSPTSCPVNPSPVVKVTTKIVYMTKTITASPTSAVSSSSPLLSASSEDPYPSDTAAIGSLHSSKTSESDSLVKWGAGVASTLGAILLFTGIVGLVRRRRRRYYGAHHLDSEYDEYALEDHDLTGRDYVETLGRHAEETNQNETVEIPPVE